MADSKQEFTNKNGITSDNQHRFIKDHFCQANLLTFYEEASNNLHGGRPVDVIFLKHLIQYPTNA